jgi:hypothetical protein
MKRRPQPNVLFVNVGWAQRYDGSHTIFGNHGDIKRQSGNPSKLGEGKAFLPDSTGHVRCVVGMGRIRPGSDIDVAFVARNPNTKQYQIVGIYHKPSFFSSLWTNPKGRQEIWTDASTRDFIELVDNQRPNVEWPRGWSMRRWVRRRGTIYYPALFNKYVALI